MLKNLFQNKSNKLTKIEYWKKWDFFDLLKDLHKAEKLLSEYTGGYSGSFLSVEEFHEAFIEAIDDIEFGNQTDLTRFYFWFAPTCQWDDFVGLDGQDLGNKIFERVSNWYESEGNKT